MYEAFSSILITKQSGNLTYLLVPILVRSVAIASDALVLVITWSKTFAVWRASLQLDSLRPQMSTLFFRDGEYYNLFRTAIHLTYQIGSTYFT